MIFRIFEFFLGFLAIGLIVFLHEVGHYFAARFFKVDVDVLSYGMGPRVYSIYGRNTEFRISAFPFGGYCRMKGSIDLEKALRDEEDSILHKESGSYFAAAPMERFLIYLAGPLTNYLIAFILLFLASIIPVERISDKAYIAPVSAYPELFNVDIKQDAIRKGDLVLAVDGVEVEDYQEMRSLLPKNGDETSLQILRDGERLDIEIKPTMLDGSFSFGITLYQEPVIGNSSVSELKTGDRIIEVNGKKVFSTLDVYENGDDEVFHLLLDRNGERFTYTIASHLFPFSWRSEIVRRSDVPTSRAFSYALRETNDFFVSTFRALAALVTLHVDDARKVITGPVNAASSIGSISTEAFSVSARSGVRTLLYLMAIVSISLSIGNILPIPTFDGGQMLICIAEMIRHGGLKARTYVHLQITGIVLALLIMLGMYYFDIKDFFF